MKILHIVASLSSEWGGPPRVVQGLTEALAKRGVEISIFAPRRRGEENSLIYPKGVEVKTFEESLPISRIWRFYSPALAKALNEEISYFDIIHIHEIWHYSHFIAYRVAKKFKKPFIITPHGALEPWHLNYKSFKKKIFAFLIQKRILNQAAVIQALTETEAKDIRNFGVNNQIEVIPNGIDFQDFQELPPHQGLEKTYPELRNKRVLLFLGRIHLIKGLDILARSFGQIARRRNDVRLVIVGPDSGGYQKEIERILKLEGVLDKTVFTGVLTGKEKLAAFSRANIFVFPSYAEGFSMAILEAMVCGLPIIITNRCNFPEIAENKAGLIINPNEDELTEAIIRLLENPVLAKEMGENGQKLVREKFTWDKIADNMIDLYKSIIRSQVEG